MSLHPLALPAGGILLYEVKHTDGDVVREHHHEFHQVLYALDGTGSILLNGDRHAWGRDHLAVIVPGAEHAVVSDTKLTVLVLAFDEAVLDAAVRRELLGGPLAFSALFRPAGLDGGELRHLLRKLLFEQSSGHALNDLALRLFLTELLLVIARSARPTAANDANDIRAERIRQLLDTRYYENWSLQSIASVHGMSTRYVNLLFKERYGVTPMRYLTGLRIEMAKRQLAETDKDIASICFELGFETVSTFYRIFKDAVHLPPNRYRQLHARREP